MMTVPRACVLAVFEPCPRVSGCQGANGPRSCDGGAHATQTDQRSCTRGGRLFSLKGHLGLYTLKMLQLEMIKMLHVMFGPTFSRGHISMLAEEGL